MLALIQNYKNGELSLVEAPAPSLARGCVLVRNHYSFVSPGTELASVRFAKKSLLGKALARKDLLGKVLDKVKRDGLKSAFKSAMARLEEPLPMGYSCAGVVEAVSEDAPGFKPGDRVACAGMGYASHAGAVLVPKNLVVKVPDGVSLRDASSVTLGSIALQAHRVAGLRLGEVAVVLGLGIIGQLLVRILRSAGCPVYCFDPDARSAANAANLPGVSVFTGMHELLSAVESGTNGAGADSVIMAASTESNEPVEVAPKLLRKKGSLVILGVSGIDVPRTPYYMKSIDIRFSTSYGPGRYDPQYEEYGHDYPIEHARWTENRNMSSYLHLIADGKIELDNIMDGEFPISDGPSVYERLDKGELRTAVFSYDTEKPLPVMVNLPAPSASKKGGLKFAMLGAGTFARLVLLPNLLKLGAVPGTLCTRTPAKGAAYAKKYEFEKTTSDAEEALAQDFDFAVIATPHSEHSRLLRMAMEKGRPVFCEKPLAINSGELDEIIATYEKTKTPFMAGFNRRFSPPVAAVIKKMMPGAPAFISYIVNAGQADKKSWVAQPQEGGRILGEVCHFVDTCIYLAASEVESVFAVSPETDDPPDECAATLRFTDGSVAQIIYSARSSRLHPKERIEIHRAQRTAVIDNFRKLTLVGESRTAQKFGTESKGHFEELRHFISSLKGETNLDENIRSAFATTSATLAIVESLRVGAPVSPATIKIESSPQ